MLREMHWTGGRECLDDVRFFDVLHGRWVVLGPSRACLKEAVSTPSQLISRQNSLVSLFTQGKTQVWRIKQTPESRTSQSHNWINAVNQLQNTYMQFLYGNGEVFLSVLRKPWGHRSEFQWPTFNFRYYRSFSSTALHSRVVSILGFTTDSKFRCTVRMAMILRTHCQTIDVNVSHEQIHRSFAIENANKYHNCEEHYNYTWTAVPPPFMPDCGGNVEVPLIGVVTFQSPFFPSPYPPNLLCVYHIRSPPGTVIQVSRAA